jgi:hypothetical protein
MRLKIDDFLGEGKKNKHELSKQIERDRKITQRFKQGLCINCGEIRFKGGVLCSSCIIELNKLTKRPNF